jgi:Zinc finger, C3HC4 type (RING finger)
MCAIAEVCAVPTHRDLCAGASCRSAQAPSPAHRDAASAASHDKAASCVGSGEAAAAMAPPDHVEVDLSEADDDKACGICYDGVPEFVFMDCGHGGYCQKCAHKLFVRPPHHCPICRKLLAGVVRVPLSTYVGESATIRPP